MKCVRLSEYDATALHLHAVVQRDRYERGTPTWERWDRIIDAVEQATTAKLSDEGATVVVRAGASPEPPSCSRVITIHDCEDWYNEGLGCAVCHAWMMERRA